MKNNFLKFLPFVTILIIAISLSFPITAIAAKPVDELTDYTITVDMREDGTLDISYDLTWHVVEDDGEALTYVDFGIPNEHVDEIKSRSRDTIDKIEFTDDYHNSDGSYVKILLKDKYYEGSYIHIAFSIHQSYMYRILKSDQQLRYNFTPGWFNEMEVKKITIKWNADKVQEVSDNATSQDGYFVWTKENLSKGEHFPIKVFYDIGAYDVKESEQASTDITVIIVVIVVILLLVIVVFLIYVSDDGYSGGIGIGGGYYHSSCASSCACACACACAGGGRAGCSKKDFYKGSISHEKLNKALSKRFWHRFFKK